MERIKFSRRLVGDEWLFGGLCGKVCRTQTHTHCSCGRKRMNLVRMFPHAPGRWRKNGSALVVFGMSVCKCVTQSFAEVCRGVLAGNLSVSSSEQFG